MFFQSLRWGRKKQFVSSFCHFLSPSCLLSLIDRPNTVAYLGNKYLWKKYNSQNSKYRDAGIRLFWDQSHLGSSILSSRSSILLLATYFGQGTPFPFTFMLHNLHAFELFCDGNNVICKYSSSTAYKNLFISFLPSPSPSFPLSSFSPSLFSPYPLPPSVNYLNKTTITPHHSLLWNPRPVLREDWASGGRSWSIRHNLTHASTFYCQAKWRLQRQKI